MFLKIFYKKWKISNKIKIKKIYQQNNQNNKKFQKYKNIKNIKNIKIKIQQKNQSYKYKWEKKIRRISKFIKKINVIIKNQIILYNQKK